MLGCAGSAYGPVCDVCGQGKGCDWNYGTCPIDQDELVQREKKLNETLAALAQTQRVLRDLKDKVLTGHTSVPTSVHIPASWGGIPAPALDKHLGK